MTSDSPILAAALDYARRGWSVIPCEPGGKKPLLGSWKQYQDRRATEQEMRGWWKRWPNANVGIVTGAISRLVVLDIDGEDGVRSVKALGITSVKTPMVETGNGVHIYFRHPGSGLIRNFARKAPGLDLRGDGGFVVASPSIHSSGKAYILVDAETELAELPSSLRELIEAKGTEGHGPSLEFSTTSPGVPRSDAVALYVRSALEREIGRVVAAEDGTRNETLNEASFSLGQLLGAGAIERSEVERRLMAAATRSGLPQQEARATIASGMNAGISQPRDLSDVGQRAIAKSAESAERCGGSGSAAPNGNIDAIVTGIPGPSEPFTSLDLGVLNSSRRPAPLLPVEVFGAFWGPAIKSGAEAAGAPVDYVAGSLLAGAAGLIGDSRRVSPWAGWTEPCALWVALVGLPSSGKSPAKDKVLDLLRAIERDIGLDFPARHTEWIEAAQTAKAVEDVWKGRVENAIKKGDSPPPRPAAAEPPAEPVMPRVIVSDATVEKLARLLVAYPRGLLAHFDELARLLGNLDKYGGQGGDRAFWIEAFGGRSFSVDRVKDAKPILVPALLMSILGAIQPDRLASGLLRSDDDGFVARFLWFWPEAVPPHRPRTSLDDIAAHAALRRLCSLAPTSDGESSVRPRVIPLEPSAADVFAAWRIEHARSEGERAGPLASHYGKMPGLVLRLALVVEHLWWTASQRDEPKDIGRPALEAAIQLVESYFKPMAERVFGDAGLPRAEKNAATIARWIVQERPERINARDLRRQVRLPGLREAKEIAAAIGVLGEAGWLRRSPARAGISLGRTREDYEVNPAALVALSSRAKSAVSANRT